MATPDWTTVPDTNLEPGDPIRSIDIIGINNHAAAMAGGAAGAPEIKLMAIETLSSGTVIRSRRDSEVSYEAGDEQRIVHEFSFSQIGTVNVYAEHKVTGSIGDSILYVYRTRNGTQTLITSWTTASSSYVARNIDVSVLPGDNVQIVSSEGGVLTRPYVRNARFRTNGENLWPGSAVPLENDYTVV